MSSHIKNVQGHRKECNPNSKVASSKKQKKEVAQVFRSRLERKNTRLSVSHAKDAKNNFKKVSKPRRKRFGKFYAGSVVMNSVEPKANVTLLKA